MTLESLELEYGEDPRWQVRRTLCASFLAALPGVRLALGRCYCASRCGHAGVRGGPEAGAAGSAAGAAAEGGRAGRSRGIADSPGGLQARCPLLQHAQPHMLCAYAAGLIYS